MKNLLNKTENRRLSLINTLISERGWITITNLAKKINVSERILKDDLAFFRNNIDDFRIKSSQKGIKLVFEKNKGLKTISKTILTNSISYQLLEKFFLDETKSVNQLSKELFISNSTLYRVINEINQSIKIHNMEIKTNPCRLVGEEQKIRYFSYQYFFERYSRLDWPFPEINENLINKFLELFMQFSYNPVSYASLNTLKIVFIINLIRYKNNHYIDTSHITGNNYINKAEFNEFKSFFKEIENNLNVKINDNFIKQIFYAYLEEDFLLSYEMFEQKATIHEQYQSELAYLNNSFDNLCEKYNLGLDNKKTLIISLHNSAYLEYQEPQSGYILYNQHRHFAEAIKKEYPIFYDDLYNGIERYRNIIHAPNTEKGIHFLIYTIFIHWKNLIPNLRKNNKKVHTLVISDRHISHAYMLEDFLNQKYPQLLETEIFSEISISKKALENKSHELIVTNFPFPELKSKKLVYIQNVPSHEDLANIQLAISKIMDTYNTE